MNLEVPLDVDLEVEEIEDQKREVKPASCRVPEVLHGVASRREVEVPPR